MTDRIPFLYDYMPMVMLKEFFKPEEIFIYEFFMAWNRSYSTDEKYFHSLAILDSLMGIRSTHIRLRIKSKDYSWSFEINTNGVIAVIKEAEYYINNIDEIIEYEKNNPVESMRWPMDLEQCYDEI